MHVPVYGWIRSSFIDYPGHICSCIFLARCNFRCGYCHNPDLVDVPACAEPEVSTAQIVEYLERYRKVLEGVCVTGGEPLLTAGIFEFLREIRCLELKIKVDTNGSLPDTLERLLDQGLVDYVAMDIKGPLEKLVHITRAHVPESHLKDAVTRSVSLLMSGAVEYEFRTTVVPGLLEEKDFDAIGRWIEGSARFVLQQFRPGRTLDPAFASVRPYPPEYLERISDRMKNFVKDCSIRGSG